MLTFHKYTTRDQWHKRWEKKNTQTSRKHPQNSAVSSIRFCNQILEALSSSIVLEAYPNMFLIQFPHYLPLVAQLVKNLPAVQETWVQSLDQEMANYSSVLAWKIPWTGEPNGLQSTGSQRIRHNWATNTQHTFLTTDLFCWITCLSVAMSFQLQKHRGTALGVKIEFI